MFAGNRRSTASDHCQIFPTVACDKAYKAGCRRLGRYRRRHPCWVAIGQIRTSTGEQYNRRLAGIGEDASPSAPPKPIGEPSTSMLHKVAYSPAPPRTAQSGDGDQAKPMRQNVVVDGRNRLGPSVRAGKPHGAQSIRDGVDDGRIEAACFVILLAEPAVDLPPQAEINRKIRQQLDRLAQILPEVSTAFPLIPGPEPTTAAHPRARNPNSRHWSWARCIGR